MELIGCDSDDISDSEGGRYFTTETHISYLNEAHSPYGRLVPKQSMNHRIQSRTGGTHEDPRFRVYDFIMPKNPSLYIFWILKKQV